MSDMRTPPTGPENGRPEIWVDALAALIARTSYWWSGWTDSTVMTTWTSLKKPSGNSRLIDRPIRPLFPEGFFNEVHVVIHTLSLNPEVDADIAALNIPTGIPLTYSFTEDGAVANPGGTYLDPEAAAAGAAAVANQGAK